MTHEQEPGPPPASAHGHDPSGSRFWIALGVFAAFAVVLLWEEHRAHILGVLPWLILLACPLMHRFMHGGHDHGHAPHDDHSQGGGRHDP